MHPVKGAIKVYSEATDGFGPLGVIVDLSFREICR